VELEHGTPAAVAAVDTVLVVVDNHTALVVAVAAVGIEAVVAVGIVVAAAARQAAGSKA